MHAGLSYMIPTHDYFTTLKTFRPNLIRMHQHPLPNHTTLANMRLGSFLAIGVSFISVLFGSFVGLGGVKSMFPNLFFMKVQMTRSL